MILLKTNNDLSIAFGKFTEEGRDKIFYYVDDNIPQDFLCYATIALISEFFRRIWNISLTDTEKVQNAMPYLEKMLLRFPIEFSTDIIKSEESEKFEDEILEKLESQIPEELRNLIKQRKK